MQKALILKKLIGLEFTANKLASDLTCITKVKYQNLDTIEGGLF